MAEELEFDLPSLQEASRSLGEVGRQLGAEWQALVSTAEGMGDIFGDDDVGSLIAITYQAAQQIAHEAYESAARGFEHFGTGLADMATIDKETEQATSGQVNEIGRAV